MLLFSIFSRYNFKCVSWELLNPASNGIKMMWKFLLAIESKLKKKMKVYCTYIFFFSMSLKFALLAFIFLLNRIFFIYLLFSSLGEHEGKFAFVDL